MGERLGDKSLAALRELARGETTARDLRAALARDGSWSGIAFYLMMAELGSEGLVEGWYVPGVVDVELGLAARVRRYRITDAGRAAAGLPSEPARAETNSKQPEATGTDSPATSLAPDYLPLTTPDRSDPAMDEALKPSQAVWAFDPDYDSQLTRTPVPAEVAATSPRVEKVVLKVRAYEPGGHAFVIVPRGAVYRSERDALEAKLAWLVKARDSIQQELVLLTGRLDLLEAAGKGGAG